MDAKPTIAELTEDVKNKDAALREARKALAEAVAETSLALRTASAVLAQPVPLDATKRLKRGARVELLRPLHAAGVSSIQAAKQLGMRSDNARAGYRILDAEVQGNPDAFKREVQPPAPPKEPPAPQPRSTAQRLFDPSEEAVRHSVRKQLIARSGQPATLWSSVDRSHRHIVSLDGRGNGKTSPAADGHIHQVEEWGVLTGPDGHAHGLSNVSAPPEVKRK